jgi:hypothetical protein
MGIASLCGNNMDSLAGVLSGVLSGLITITVSLKALNIVFRVNKDNISIIGNNNIVQVRKEYNQQLKDDRGNYKLLWGFVATVLFFAFPFHPAAFCSSLYVVAWLCPVIALIAYVVNFRQLGFQRLWDIFYIPASLALTWTTIESFPYLSAMAPYGAYHHDVNVLWSSLPYGAKYLIDNYVVVLYALESVSVCIGFCLLYLAQFWLGFSFLRWRSFDGALINSASLLAIGICGAVMTCGLVPSIENHNFAFVGSAFHVVIDPIVNFFP